MFDPGPCFYMHQIAGSAEIADLLDLDRPLGETLRLVAKRKGIDIGDVMVVMLDRPRHDESDRAVREAGARVRFIADGDVAGSLLAVTDDAPMDLLWAYDGTPEGVLSTAAIKCIGGGMLGRLWPRAEKSARRQSTPAMTSTGCSPMTNLISGNDFFSATRVTDGDVLQGHRAPDQSQPRSGRDGRGPRG